MNVNPLKYNKLILYLVTEIFIYLYNALINIFMNALIPPLCAHIGYFLFSASLQLLIEKTSTPPFLFIYLNH